MLQIKLEAEKERAQMRDEVIKELRSDKRHLREQVVHVEELLKLKAGKEAQSGKITLDQIKIRLHSHLAWNSIKTSAADSV